MGNEDLDPKANAKDAQVIQERLASIRQIFGPSADWDSKYRLLINWAKELPRLPESDRREDLLIKGCQSQVWLKCEPRGELLIFTGDSEALIVRGLVQLLIKMYSALTPEQILILKPDFLKDLGLESHLSPSRANGLFSMVKQIQYYALALKALHGQKA